MNGWKETHVCVCLLFYTGTRSFISSLDSWSSRVCYCWESMGIFLFSEAFLSREATARGTPREKSTWCRSYQVISSSFTRLHSISPLQFFSLYLSLLFPFYQFTNNCSTDLGIVVINRSLVRRTNEWNLRGVWRRENSAKKREKEREKKKEGEEEGRKK